MEITVSYNTAVKLVNAGWKDETKLIWVHTGGAAPKLTFYRGQEEEYVPAPTFIEIWELLPEFLRHFGNLLTLSKAGIGYEDGHSNEEVLLTDPTEAAARLWAMLNFPAYRSWKLL